MKGRSSEEINQFNHYVLQHADDFQSGLVSGPGTLKDLFGDMMGQLAVGNAKVDTIDKSENNLKTDVTNQDDNAGNDGKKKVTAPFQEPERQQLFLSLLSHKKNTLEMQRSSP